jgi:hypothetical protein
VFVGDLQFFGLYEKGLVLWIILDALGKSKKADGERFYGRGRSEIVGVVVEKLGLFWQDIWSNFLGL